MKGTVFGGGAVNSAIANATCGEEAGLLVSRKVEPDSFGLQVIEDISESGLERLDLECQWLLKVEEETRSLASTRITKCIDPDVGGVEVLQQVSRLLGVYGGEGLSFCETRALEPFEGMFP